MKKLIKPTNKFEKDLKTVRKYPRFKREELEVLIDSLAEGKTLEQRYKDHKLAKHSPGELAECRCFHYAPNICVIYKSTSDSIILIRIGSHSDLGMTETLHK